MEIVHVKLLNGDWRLIGAQQFVSIVIIVISVFNLKLHELIHAIN